MTIETPSPNQDNIAYIRHMLGELRAVADAEDCRMLCYLIEMAYVEAGDIQLGKQPSKVGLDKQGERSRMSG